jgi:LPS-assembly protein
LSLLCACAHLLLLPMAAQAQESPPALLGNAPATEALRLRPVKSLTKAKPGDKSVLVIGAERLSLRVDQEASASGAVELRSGELLLKADSLKYEQVEDFARALGNVEVNKGGNLFSGPELQLYINRFEGEFLNPSYFLSLTGGRGRAERVKFAGSNNVLVIDGTYSSCPVREDGQVLPWELSASKLELDFDANVGVATGAVVRFYGVPILPAPRLSFPLGLGRKSGWLPPNFSFDKRSGVEFGLPYYWDIAPQRDATLTPFTMTRRGVGLDSEFRYLEPDHAGTIKLAMLPHDSLVGRSRWALNLAQSGELARDWRYRLGAEHVSDDDYWKDLPSRLQTQTERLLPTDLQFDRRQHTNWGEAHSYVRVQRWQVLQGLDPEAQFAAPYQRSPQVGLRLTSASDDAVLEGFRPWGRKSRLEGSVELEYNRFDLPPSALPTQTQTGGQRAHLLAHVSAPMGGAAWWLIPRLEVNAAQYGLDQARADGRKSIGRTVTTFSVDHGWVFERDTAVFERQLTQTLEPRVLYVNTPYRAQQEFPNFDSAAKDFNFDSIYSSNQFSGIDRVSDAHQLTAGVVSRWVDNAQGAELLRLGLVQRYLFRDQLVTPDGEAVTQRFSDLLLLGSAHLRPEWWTDGSVQFNPNESRPVRTVMRARYSPGPFRTLSMAYRLTRGQSEHVELAWQWPIYGQEAGAKRDSAGCGGAWYSAGRVQYSMFDRKLTDSVLGFEYDAGCWVFRVGAERLSTGRAETNTRLMLQLELVGLSQLGSNALKVLRDNIPGYRRLSNDRSASTEAPYD